MPNYSEFKGLELPLSIERYNIEVFNNNAQIIDTELHSLEEKNQEQDRLLATKESVNEHINDKENPHDIKASQIGLGNVENKSSEQIRSELTSDDVTHALGYMPYTPGEIENRISTLETNIEIIALALNELKKYVSDGKKLVADAITDKGVETATTDTFEQMANNIGDIKGGGAVGSATAAQVLKGYTFSNDTDSGIDGEMVDNGAWNGTLSSKTSIIIPKGYHNGSGTVTASYNAATGNATAAQVLAGRTFSTASLTGASGTMVNQGAWSSGIYNNYEKIKIPAGYHNGSGTVTASIYIPYNMSILEKEIYLSSIPIPTSCDSDTRDSAVYMAISNSVPENATIIGSSYRENDGTDKIKIYYFINE